MLTRYSLDICFNLIHILKFRIVFDQIITILSLVIVLDESGKGNKNCKNEFSKARKLKPKFY